MGHCFVSLSDPAVWCCADGTRLVLQFVMPETVVISVMVDTIVFGFLFVLALGVYPKPRLYLWLRALILSTGGVGAVSSNAGWYRRWDVR